MTTLAPDTRSEPIPQSAEPEAPATVTPDAPPQPEQPGPWLTCASAALSTAAAAVLVGGLFSGGFATGLALLAVGLGAGLATLSFWLQRPALVQWGIVPALGFAGFAAAAAEPGAGSRNPVDLARAALRAGGIEQAPIPFDPGWRLVTVVLLGGLAAGLTMVAVSYVAPKLAVFGPVPLTFGALLLQPSDGGSVRTGAALALLVCALVLSFGVDLGRQGVVSATFQMRRIARGMASLAVLLVALGGITQLDFLYPPPKQEEVVPPQKPQLPPPEPDRVLFSVRAPVVLPWRLGTLDVFDGSDWLTPPFDRQRLQPVPAGGALPAAGRGGRTVSVTFTLRDVRDRVIPGVLGARTLRRPDGFAVDADPRTQMLRLPDRLPRAGQTYTIEARVPPSGAELRRAPAAPRALAEFTEVPPAPPAVQALLDKAPRTSPYDRLQYLRAAYYRAVVAAGPGKPVSTPVERVTQMLAGEPASPYEIAAVEVLLARWSGVPARLGYGYYDGEKAGAAVLEVRPRHGATWLEVYFPGYGWVPLLGTPPRAQGSLGSKNQNPNVRPSEDLALTVYIPVQQSTVRLFYTLARYWALRILPWLLGLLLALWAYPALFKAIRRVRRNRWAAARGPRERVAVAYLEFRDLATDLNIGTPTATPLEFLDRVAPDDDHLELAWLVTRSLWGDLRRDCRDEDAVVAEEVAASLRRRLRGAQPSFNRILAAASRASLRRPASRELPNVWWPSRAAVRAAFRRSLRRLRPVARRPMPAGATAAVIALVLLLSACAQEVPLQSGDRSGLPDRTVPKRLNGYTFRREAKAEQAYLKAGRNALVEAGEVYTVHADGNVYASVQVAPFKRGLLDAGRRRELRDSVFGSLGSGSLELKRIGSVTYRLLALNDRKVLLYLPADTTYMLLLVARPTFDDAERLLGALVAYQRGEDGAVAERVAEVRDPLRGIDP